MGKPIVHILFLCLCWSLNINAQSSLGAFSVLAPDTAYTQTTDSFFVSIKNTGTILVNDSIQIMAKVNSGAPFIFYHGPALLPPNALEVIGSKEFDFDSLGLAPAYNIVVVWPTGTGIVTSDSATFSIYYIDNTGIQSRVESKDSEINIYPNPAKAKLYFEYSNSLTKLEEVRIIDILGKEYYRSKSTHSEIEIPSLSNGLYFILFLFADHTQKAKPFTIIRD